MTKNFLENKGIICMLLLGLTTLFGGIYAQEILACETFTAQADQEAVKVAKEKLSNGIKDI
jgi:hypothetical protein